MSAFTELKHGLEEVWESLSEGWNHIRERAASALTRFRPGAKSDVPVRANEGPFPFTAPTWALLAGEVFEDERRVVVRLEVPGLESRDLDLEVRDDVLVVRDEKRFEHEESEGSYRLQQVSAYCPAAGTGAGGQGQGSLPQRRVEGGAAQGRGRAASRDSESTSARKRLWRVGSLDKGNYSCAIFRAYRCARGRPHPQSPLAEPSG